MNAPVDANFGRLSHVNEPKRHQMLAKDLGRLRSIIPSDFTKAATCRDEAGGYAQRLAGLPFEAVLDPLAVGPPPVCTLPGFYGELT